MSEKFELLLPQSKRKKGMQLKNAVAKQVH